MLSLKSALQATGLLLPLASASLYGQSTSNHTCVLTNDPLVLSCSTTANPSTVDPCCVETYGGLLLATQFWSTYTGLESQGQLLPPSSWTLHGLWPDFCNGSYTQYCDLSRQYDPTPSPNTTTGTPAGKPVPPYKGANIGTFLQPFGKFDLLAYMNKFWINQNAPNSDFWGHEFSKHATCFSTFDVPCYGPQYVEHEEVVDFFETAIMYFRRLPTYAWLASAGITPSNTTTYSLRQFQDTLKSRFGGLPYVGCSGPRYNETAAGRGTLDNGRTSISEVWYYFNAFGRPQSGNVLPTNAGSFNTTCARTTGALHYYERTASSIQKS